MQLFVVARCLLKGVTALSSTEWEHLECAIGEQHRVMSESGSGLGVKLARG